MHRLRRLRSEFRAVCSSELTREPRLRRQEHRLYSAFLLRSPALRSARLHRRMSSALQERARLSVVSVALGLSLAMNYPVQKERVAMRAVTGTPNLLDAIGASIEQLRLLN